MELTWMNWHSERNRSFSSFGVEGWMGVDFLGFLFYLPSSILLLKMQAAGLDSFPTTIVDGTM